MDESQSLSSSDNIELKVKVSNEELKDFTTKHFSTSKELGERRNEYEIAKERFEAQLARCTS
jgi:hypothetical protein